MIATVYAANNLMSSAVVEVEQVAPGVGRIACLECEGDPEAYPARFGEMREALAPDGCVDCKNRGWVYVTV